MFTTIPKFFGPIGILSLLLITVLAACSSPGAVPQTSATTTSSTTQQASAIPFPKVTPQAFAASSPSPTPQTTATPSPTAKSQASSMAAPTTETGITTDSADVRTATSTSAPIDHVDPPNTTVTIYATVSGQIISGDSSTWYRVSSFTGSPLYIYGGDLTTASSGNTNATTTSAPAGNTASVSATTSAPTGQGKIIVVSISQEELDAYDNGQLFVSTPVATGRPQLPTLLGTYHIFGKYSPYRFISPWPVGSPYYYAPVTANYAMEWAAGGYFLHDAPWRGYFGKGANNWHWDSLMGEDPGTHGCIDVPTGPMSQLYSWATSGTTVQVVP